MKYIIVICLLGVFSSSYAQKASKRDVKKFTKLIEQRDSVGASIYLSEHIELKENEVINAFFSLYGYQRLKMMFQENKTLRESVWRYIYREHRTELLKENVDELNRLYMSFQVCRDDIVSIASQLDYSDFLYGELNRIASLEIFSNNDALKKRIELVQSNALKTILDKDVVKMAQTLLHEKDTTLIPLVMEDIIRPQLPAFSLQELASVVPAFRGSVYYDEILYEYQNKLEGLLANPCYKLITSISLKLEKLLPQIQKSLGKDMAGLYNEFLGGIIGINSLKNNLFKKKENTNKTFINLWEKYNRQKYYSDLLNKEITSEIQNFIINRNTFLKYFIEEDFKSEITDFVITVKLKPNFKVMRNTVEENFSSVACDLGMGIGDLAVSSLFPPAAPYVTGFTIGWGLGDSIDEEEYFISNQTEYLYAQITVEIESYLNSVQALLRKENIEIITLIINEK